MLWRKKENKESKRKTAQWQLARLLLLCVCMFFISYNTVSAAVLPQEMVADIVKPTVMRVVLHVTGTAQLTPAKVDIGRRFIAADTEAKTPTIPIDEYLTGSGFVVDQNGYIATNAHVVSADTIKYSLASEAALSAFYESALYMSDEAMEAFLRSEGAESFGRKIIRTVMESSDFDLRAEVFVLHPRSHAESFEGLISEAFPAQVAYVSDDFFENDTDVALLKIEETGLPALRLGSDETLSVGKKSLIFGFPSTAELNEKSPLEATFTQGVISALKTGSEGKFPIYQTDAKVSQGSSGGPLFNESGEAVGMVTFQTDEFSRGSGDNFAFALPISLVREALKKASISLSPSSYFDTFTRAMQSVQDRRCNKAEEDFQNVSRSTNRVFEIEKIISPYQERCQELRRKGETIDTRFAEWQAAASSLGNPFLWFVGFTLFVMAFFGAALFWLIRQVKREDSDISGLSVRLRRDEKRFDLSTHRYGEKRIRREGTHGHSLISGKTE